METTVKLLIADSQKFTRNGTRALLKDFSTLSIVFEAEDGRQVLEFLKEHNVDIVLLPVYYL